MALSGVGLPHGPVDAQAVILVLCRRLHAAEEVVTSSLFYHDADHGDSCKRWLASRYSLDWGIWICIWSPTTVLSFYGQSADYHQASTACPDFLDYPVESIGEHVRCPSYTKRPCSRHTSLIVCTPHPIQIC